MLQNMLKTTDLVWAIT